MLERIGPVVYKLQLPDSSQIHPVFHISLLKLHQGPLPHSPAELPQANSNNHPLVTPLTILAWKCDNSVSPPIIKVSVQWDGLAPEDTSWELWDELRQTHNLEDKVVLGEGGIDSNNNTAGNNTCLISEASSNINRPMRVTKKPNYLQEYV